MKLIIFDVDGVLEKKELLFKKRKEVRIKAIAKKKNVSIEEVDELVSKAILNLPKEKRETTAHIIQEIGFTRQEYFDMVNSVDPKGLIEPYEGIEILDILREKYPLVAYSNTPLLAVERTLDIIKVKEKFKTFYTADDFTESKPSPKILRKIIEKEGSTPEETFYIGDSLSKDMAPAKTVGCTAIFFNPDKKKVDKSLFDLEIHNLMELKEILK